MIRPRSREDLAAENERRFREKIAPHKHVDGCLIWIGSFYKYKRKYVPDMQYPAMNVRDFETGRLKLVYVKRWALERALGRLLQHGETVEMTCGEPTHCVNAEHMKVVYTGRGRPPGSKSPNLQNPSPERRDTLDDIERLK